MTDASHLFIDTNILIYATTRESPFYQAARQALITAHQQQTTLWVSRQVLREYLAVTTRPQAFKTPPTKATILQTVDFFLSRFQIADDNALVTHYLLDLITQHEVGGKQIHDANIVATMQANNLNRLLTCNIDDFKRFDKIINIETIK